MTAELKRLLDEATVGSRELDAEVARWLGYVFVPSRNEGFWRDKDGRALIGRGVPEWSTDLTPAVGLVEEVLPEAGWLVGAIEGEYMAELFRTRYISGIKPRLAYAKAPTPALAIIRALVAAVEAS